MESGIEEERVIACSVEDAKEFASTIIKFCNEVDGVENKNLRRFANFYEEQLEQKGNKNF